MKKIRYPFFNHLTAIAMAAMCIACPVHSQTFNGASLAPVRVNPTVDQAYTKLSNSQAIKKLLETIKADHDRTTEEMKTFTEIEAPAFKEQKRAEAFLARIRALGITDARIDTEGNVIGVRKGTGNGPKLVVSAHLDTVFPAGTNVKVKERDGRLYAPGVADDTRGLAVLLSWLKALNENKIVTVGDVVFVANVGEEGIGDLRGMKAVFRDNLDIDGMVGLENVLDGEIWMAGTGSHRYEVTFKGPGGHSFGRFGLVPSAIHGAGRAIAKIAEVKTPSFPKTTFTVGTVSGGTSVNTIAPEAKIAIDIRSDALEPLLQTEKKILAAVDEGVAEENRRWGVNTLSASVKKIGDRPVGRTPADSPIVEAAMRSNAAFGHKSVLLGNSTDANVPMSLGIPGLVIGTGGKFDGIHTTEEWIDVTDAWKGAQNALMIVLGLVGVDGVSAPLLVKRPPRKP